MPGLLYGRRIVVVVGDQVVVNLDPAVPEVINEQRNLDVDFSVSTHAKPEPLVCDVTIYGLNEVQRNRLQAAHDEARQQAWQKYQAVVVGETLVEPDQVAEASANLVTQGASIVVAAGYGDDFGIIHRGTLLPDGLEQPKSEGHYKTSLRSQDNRLAWSNAFVSEEVAPGVTLVDYQRALALSEQFLAGDIGGQEVAEQAPGILDQKLDAFGYENGKVLHGQTRDESQKLMDTLGLRPFLVDGQPYYLPIEATRFTEAVVLQYPGDGLAPSPGGLLSVTQMPRGFQQVRCLLNYRMSAGRQVRLRNADGTPIGSGLYRVEHATHTGSAWSPSYYTDAVLRPTAVAPENNS